MISQVYLDVFKGILRRPIKQNFLLNHSQAPLLGAEVCIY